MCLVKENNNKILKRMKRSDKFLINFFKMTENIDKIVRNFEEWYERERERELCSLQKFELINISTFISTK